MRSRTSFFLITTVLFVASTPLRSGAQPGNYETITLDGRHAGRTFDGVGGVNASSSRLLYDYPEPTRSQILDYLFKPNTGAAIQVLKVEIGSDVNSTDIAEPSHMRFRDDLNYERGFEWWMMKEAKARNPDLILAALLWGAPGWFENGFWSQDNIDYISKWLDGAKKHGLKIDYVGGWNESGYDVEWFIALDKALADSHPEVKIVAADDLPHHNWRVAKDMTDNPKFRNAVDVLGQHSPGGWRSEYKHYSTTPEALKLEKPLWASEQSALSHDVGGGPWARAINRAYIDAKITASLNWAIISSWFPHQPHADTGLILAEWPWSGYYQMGSMVWVYAHTTQFTRPGWQYLDSACGYLDNGASYVTLKSPEASSEGYDYSVVIETMDAKEPVTVNFKMSGGLSTKPVQVWSSNIASDTLDDDFVHEATRPLHDEQIAITFRPGHVYTLSTTTGQGKGNATPPSTVAAQMPLPFFEDFENYDLGKLARYFVDINGGYETASAGGEREGIAYRQMVPQQPITWNLAGAGAMPPTTMFGDVRWWGDYEVSADVLLEQEGAIEIIGRIAAQAGAKVAGYHLQFDSKGTWRLYSEDLSNYSANEATIATGQVLFPVGKWHRVALRMEGERISIIVNGEVVGTAIDSRHTTGNVALRVCSWQPAQFDNIAVTPTASAPNFIPQNQLTATATSEHDKFTRGDVFPVRYATDGRPESLWQTSFGSHAQLPQSLTVDLGNLQEVEGLTYQPRLDNVKDGTITGYNVYLSSDGKNYSRVVAGGSWPISTAVKVIRWPAQKARYVRLEIVDAAGKRAAVGEVRVIAATSVALQKSFKQINTPSEISLANH